MNTRNARKNKLRKAYAQRDLRIGEFLPAVALVGFGETIRLDENPNAQPIVSQLVNRTRYTI